MYAPDSRATNQTVMPGTVPIAVSHDARIVAMAERYADSAIADYAQQTRELIAERETRNQAEHTARRAALACEIAAVIAAAISALILLSIGGPDLIAGIVGGIPATLQIVVRLARLAG